MSLYLSKNRGISLLELLLSLALIAILLIMVTRYFQTTRSAEQTNEAVAVLQTLIDANDTWYWTYKSYEKPSIDIPALTKLGLVPQDFEKPTANPWGGKITNVKEDSDHVKITFTNVPKGDCLNLKELMEIRGLIGNCDTTEEYNAIYPKQILN